jgi:hypothetical protein
MGMVRLFGWAANQQPLEPLLRRPGHNLLPAGPRPELIGSATAGMKGDHPLIWQTGGLPKVCRERLRCWIQVDVGAGIVWLADKVPDGLQEMVSNMHAWRWMWLPHEDFSLTVAPQVGSKSQVGHRKVRENQLKTAQICCQAL